MMPSPSFEISSFRPRRGLFGYERKATDELIAYAADMLEHTSSRLDEAERELAEYREKEQSLNDALLAVAKSAEAVKADARRQAESIRANAREVDELVATTCTHLSSFLGETLATLERVAAEIQSRGETLQAREAAAALEEPAVAGSEEEAEPEPVAKAEPVEEAEPEPVGSAGPVEAAQRVAEAQPVEEPEPVAVAEPVAEAQPAEEVAADAEPESKPENGTFEGDNFIERLRPYQTGAADGARSPRT